MQRWEMAMKGYLEELENRGISKLHQANIQRELEHLGSWLRRKTPRPRLDELSHAVFTEYMKIRSSFRSKSTVSGKLSILRCFGDYLFREKYWPKNVIRYLRGPRNIHGKMLPRRIGRDDLNKLFEAALKSREKYQRTLWSTILLVLYGTGLRRGELERLDFAAWNAEEGSLRIDGRKTGMERKIPLPPVAKEALESYLSQRHLMLEKRGDLLEPALFVGKQGMRMNSAHLGRGIHMLAKTAGVGRVTLHQFRHSCASDLMESGIELHKIRDVLGHVNIASTVRYSHIADPERKRAMEIHPICGILLSENQRIAEVHV